MRPECGLDIGAALNEAREARGISLEQAANDTRISLRFLEALESEEFDELPAPVYVRGFLRSYANYLGVDPQPLIEELAVRETGAGYAARPGASGGYMPSPVTAQRRQASSNPFRPQAPVPIPENVTPFPDPADGEPPDGDAWDDEPDGSYIDDTAYRAPWPGENASPTVRHESRTAGLLLEREALPGGGGGRGGIIVAAIALVIIGALAVFFLAGGDGDSPAAAPGSPTPAGSATQGTVIEVRTPTAPSGSATAEGSPGASRTPSTTASPGTTGTTTPAATATGTPSAGTATPGSAATTAPTATATFAPPTATPVPPTPTPVPPTPTATTIAHPLSYSECTSVPATGERDCGSPPFRVVCGPAGWFIDLAPIFPAESFGWDVRSSDTLGGADNVC